MKLSELCSCLIKHTFYSFSEKEIRGITCDSRKVKKDYLFVAIRGHNMDGHDFVEDAIERGAVGVVAERCMVLNSRIPQIMVPDARSALAFLSCQFYGNPSARMKVIGVTGTNGKTTTSYFSKAIVEASGKEAGLIGTILYQIRERVIPAQETTPESVEIQGYLSEMVMSGIRYAIIEASSHALAQHRLDGIHFHSAIFTNLSAEHLDYHETIQAYREQKLKLIKALDANAFAVLNADHNAGKYFSIHTKAQVIWYGIKNKQATVTAEIVDINPGGTKFVLYTPWGRKTINLKLIGKHNVYNALAAAANGLALGFDIETVKKGLESLSGVPGRLERVDYGQDFHIYIDFAHTHQALQVILSALRQTTTGRILLVFGCGGERDRKKRPKMGHIAEKYSDTFWITNDNPRSEDPLEIIREIQNGIRKNTGYRVQPDRRIAIEEALLEARRGDVVVIAGKGHERYQIFQDTVIPFDDREVVKQVLQNYAVSQS